MTPNKEDRSRGRRSTSEPLDRLHRVRRGARNNTGTTTSTRGRPRASRARARTDVATDRQRFGINDDLRTGRVRRRAASQSYRPASMLSTRESLEILHSYLDDCERNLFEGQIQRERLAQMVSQLSEPQRVEMDFFEEMPSYHGSSQQPVSYGTSVLEPTMNPMEPPQPNEYRSRGDMPGLFNTLRYMADNIMETPRHNVEGQPHRNEMAAPSAGELVMPADSTLPEPTLVEGIDLLAAGDGYHVLPINTVQLSRSADNIFAFVLELNDNPVDAPVPRPPEDSDQD